MDQIRFGSDLFDLYATVFLFYFSTSRNAASHRTDRQSQGLTKRNLAFDSSAQDEQVYSVSITRRLEGEFKQPCRRVIALLAIALTSILICSTGHACENAVEPDVLLGGLSSEMISTINDNLDETRVNPSRATKIIEDVLLPHVNFILASKKALEFVWDDLSDQQKKKFVFAFRVFLVRHSSVILADFLTGNNKKLNTNAIQFDDGYTSASANNIAVVKSKVFSNSSEFYRVGYRLYCSDEAWKIYDVVINGVSVIKQYEGQFKFKIERDGFDSLVTFLNYKNSLLLEKVRD